jgi:hypothetical protein
MSAFQAERQEFESPISLPHYGILMSLISQMDRDLAIEALDFYLFSKGNDFTEAKRAEVNALLNWVKLEKSKHEH